ncbi:Rid family hydrolase [Candidatus Latescibacterota bacterium]
MKRIMYCGLMSFFIFLLIAVSCPLSADPPVKKFATKDGSRPRGLFAPGVMIGKTFYISGKGDYRPGEPYPEKVRNCLNEVRKVLQVMGMDMENIVKSFCFLEEPERYPEFNKVYAEFFTNDPPARTTLGVPKVPGDSRIEITCIAYSDLAGKKRIGTPPEGFPFSPAILGGNTLYISGKGDHLPDGSHPKTFEEQVRQAMMNVGNVLEQASLDFQNIVLSRVYVDNYDNLGIVNKVYSEFFDYGNEPARETVFVDWIPGGSHIEITCIATTDIEGRKVVRPASMKYGPDGSAMSASPAVWAGDTLYMSSLSGFVPGKGIISGDLAQQTHQMAENHIDILKEAGLELENIVSGNVYLRDIKDYKPFNDIYREYFTKGPGVRTCLMPNSGYEKNDIRTRASFIAARTKK